MIIDKQIKVKLGSKNIQYYVNLGYVLPIGKDKRGRPRIEKENGLIVNVEDLPIGCNVKIKVQCEDCYEIREINYSTLSYRKNSSFNKTGETLCSKCANARMSGVNSPVYSHGNVLYSYYKHSAKKRNINFELTIEQFESLVPSNCFYCDETSNGIDRWDSNIGYTIVNSKPCCGECNFIKNKTSPNVFIEKIKKIYNTLTSKGY